MIERVAANAVMHIELGTKTREMIKALPQKDSNKNDDDEGLLRKGVDAALRRVTPSCSATSSIVKSRRCTSVIDMQAIYRVHSDAVCRALRLFAIFAITRATLLAAMARGRAAQCRDSDRAPIRTDPLRELGSPSV
jgi:hypothetical protein